MRIRYETQPCSRCGGCGEYSYCQMYGTTCFKCHGSGLQYTTAGRRAMRGVAKFMEEHYCRPIEEIEVGMQVRHTYERGFKTVTEGPHPGGSRYKTKEGTWEPFIEIVCKGAKVTHHMNGRAGEMIMVRPTPEQFRTEIVPKARRFKGAIIEGE